MSAPSENFVPVQPSGTISTVSVDGYLGRARSSADPGTESSWSANRMLVARYDWFRHMRAEHPVALDPETGLWGIFRYADVRRALTNVADFSNVTPQRQAVTRAGLATGPSRRPHEDPLRDSMLRVDPPRHRELRTVVNQTFTSRRVAGMRARVQVICTDLVDRGAQDGVIDVVASVARLLPTLVIGSLLGIDLARTADFQRWTDAFMRSLLHGPDAEQSRALAEMEQYFEGIIAQRRRTPGADLISAALHAEAGAGQLSDRDVLQFCKLLLIAGSETTTHLITNTVLCLQQDPQLAWRARRDAALLPGIVEEVLRWLPPVQAAPRRATRDIHAYDQLIPAGSMVYPWLGSANRDETEFPDPDVFSLNRTRGKAVAFGHGIHFCVGAALARLEAEVAAETMLRALPGTWTVPDVLTVFPAREMCGLSCLPMTWGEQSG